MIALGRVFLDDGVRSDHGRFTRDPHIQREWVPRRTRLGGLGGSSTKQDFGRWGGDLRLTLSSQGNFMGNEFKAYVDLSAAVRGKVFRYTDYQGIVADVVIRDFTPVPTFYPDVDPRLFPVIGKLFEYTLVLDVVTLIKLDGIAYTDGAGAQPPPTGARSFVFSPVGNYQVSTSTVLSRVQIFCVDSNGNPDPTYTGQATLTLNALETGTYTVLNTYVQDPSTGEAVLFGVDTTPNFVAGVCLPSSLISGLGRLLVSLHKSGNLIPANHVQLVATDGSIVGLSNVFLFCSFGVVCA